MCSIIFSTTTPINDDFNAKTKLRGPDSTNFVEINGYFFGHNLLSMRGDFVLQPYINEDTEIVILLNGEIYNCPDEYNSECAFIHDLYCEDGENFLKNLDGEFAIILVDFKSQKLIATKDCFGTKPLYFGCLGDDFGFASLPSALKQMGYTNVRSLDANFAYHIELDGTQTFRHQINNFNLAQFSKDIEGCMYAFEKAVLKRTKHVRGDIFVGLSSGYDSGAIAAALVKYKTYFVSVSVTGRESQDILNARQDIISLEKNKIINIPDFDINKIECRTWLEKYVDNFNYKIVNDDGQISDKDKSIFTDNASLILATVCAEAYKVGCRVYLSGSGADEIFSDYGFGGAKIFNHSNFGGLFPDSLVGVFPWASVYGSTQAAYLAKEENVAGSFGMEVRYPFLDKDLVQNFLNLHPSIKNKAYKSIILEYLQQNNFPVLENTKIGFGFSSNNKKLA